VTWADGKPTAYLASVTVDKTSVPGEIRLLTSPPIHAARITRFGNLWKISWVSQSLREPRFYADELAAIREAARVISAQAGRDWREKFVGAQRISIGQRRCPKLIREHSGKLDICDETPDIGTIWCKDHLSELTGMR
jgi:hypothetical protein